MVATLSQGNYASESQARMCCVVRQGSTELAVANRLSGLPNVLAKTGLQAQLACEMCMVMMTGIAF